MRRLKNLPEGEFALHKISIQRSAMNVPTVQLRIHHHVRRFRGGLHSQSGVVTTIYFRSLHSFTRRSGQHCDVTSMAPVEMRSRERLVRAIAGMSTPVERPFLTGAFLLSLAAPPTGTPLRGHACDCANQSLPGPHSHRSHAGNSTASAASPCERTK